MYLRLLKTALWLTSAANELALPFNPWLYSSASNLESDLQDWFPSIPFCASIYATSEPLWTVGLLLVPLTPLILVLGTGIAHLTVSQLLIQKSLLVENEREHRCSRSEAPVERRASHNELRSGSGKKEFEGACLLKATAIALIQSAAASNASLLLLTQSFNASGSTYVHSNVENWLSFLAFLFYLFSRMADYRVSRQTMRAFLIAGQEHGRVATQLKSLGWLILARATTRQCFGMTTLGFLEIQDADLMAARYKSERYQLIQSKVKTVPKWLPFALLALSPCTMALSHWHWNRARARASSNVGSAANQASS